MITESGLSSLARLRRGLAVSSRDLDRVLLTVARGPVDVTALAQGLDLSDEDARRTLFMLEEYGLVQSTRYVVTAAGRKEARS